MFNFRSGTALAIQQDTYIPILAGGGTLSGAQIKEMEDNAWVLIASKLAPSNLVIRQYCLIDMAKGVPEHKDKILAMMDLLSYKCSGAYRIYAEGYSYFGYTMNALEPWIAKFYGKEDLSELKGILGKIENGFIATSYLHGAVWYPIPYGDTRPYPLDPKHQIDHDPCTMTISNVTFNYIGGSSWYVINGRPIGLNTHIPKDSYMVTITNGIPVGFKFYEGYDKKYKNAWAEFLDTYNYKRLKSIPF